MAGMCFGVNIGETETAAPVESSSKAARRRRLLEIHQYKIVPSDKAVATPMESGGRRKRLKVEEGSSQRECANAVHSCEAKGVEKGIDDDVPGEKRLESKLFDLAASTSEPQPAVVVPECPKYGTTSVCGRRRDMEDAVAICPSFSDRSPSSAGGIHLFGVYDGHGCSHVATRCRDRMHEIVKSEIETGRGASWEQTMVESFAKMDKDVTEWSASGGSGDETTGSVCRCELKSPQTEAVGSTAVVAILSPDKIIVSNCGDSRAVLCRNGAAIPLSVDHKPDRPDELKRINDSGGRVIYWDGPRVLGVLAMSRAIGDNYLKPYVISEPEVTVTERTAEDECLILASDGLWDVVTNETACEVALKCLQTCKTRSPPRSPGKDIIVTPSGESSDKACSDASILLTKLALARHSADNVSVVVVDLRRAR
ncbi:protein phosphatase 2C 37 [Dorcoceras hygrometricum]|uniref:protein-serine/threonine phosphatase n=1 Tax=Dorcoceras hygrometricum TaxID=472368 RepID=A0A2Z7BL22_9LAMI|nr:protein phosphatase 2C 37 [Dorcoceras hygrometricum]